MSETKRNVMDVVLETLERHGIRVPTSIGSPAELLQAIESRGMRHEPEVVHLTVHDRELLYAVEGLLKSILARLEPDRYTIRVVQFSQENPMALGTIAPGSTGQFGAQLLNNGVPDTSGFVPTFTWTSTDPLVTFSPAATDASGGIIPLTAQIIASVPTGDVSTSVTVTATTPDPNGVSEAGPVTVAIGSVAPLAVYTVSTKQLA